MDMKKLLSVALALLLLSSLVAQAQTFAFDEAGFQIEIPDEGWMSFTGEWLSMMSGMKLPYEEEIDGLTFSFDVRLMAVDTFAGSTLIDMVATVSDEALIEEAFDTMKNYLLEGVLDEFGSFSTEEIKVTDAQWSETVFLNRPAVQVSIVAEHQAEGSVYMDAIFVKSVSSIEAIILVSPDSEVSAQMQGWFTPIGEVVNPASEAAPSAPSSPSNAA